MTEDEISIHPATPQDLELMLAWRNNPDVYEFLENQSEPIPWTDHIEWYATRDPKRRDWIISYNGRRVGAVAIAPDGDIGVWIGEQPARGEGIGRQAVQQAIEQTERSVYARVHKENQASRRLFESIGFRHVDTKNLWLIYKPK